MNRFYQIFPTFLLAFIISIAVLILPLQIFVKFFVILIVAMLILIFTFSLSMENILSLLMLMIPLPIFINLGGKDMGTTITLAIFLIFFIYSIKRVLRKEQILPHRPLFIPLMFLVLCYAISFMNMPILAMSSALRRCSVFVSCIIIFYLVINNLRSKKAIYRIIDVLTIACFLEATILIIQLIFPENSSFLQFFGNRVVDLGERYSQMENLRIVGTFGFGYEIVSEFLAINILIQFFWIQKLKKSTKKYLYIICLILSAIAMVSTATRGSIIALIVGILFTSFLARKHLNLSKQFILFCLLALLFASITFFFAEKVPYVSNLYQRFINTRIDGFIPDTRVVVWKQFIPGIMEHPWIGHGPYATGELGRYTVPPHSIFLYYLFSIGAIGTLVVLWFFAGIFWYGFSAIRKQCDQEMVYIIIVLLGAFLVFMIDEIKVSYLRCSNMQQFIWFIFALIISASQIIKKEQKMKVLNEANS